METPASPQDRTQQLLEVTSLEGRSPEEALTYISELINLAMNAPDAKAAAHAIRLGKVLIAKSLPLTYRAQLNYFLSNAWSAIHDAKRRERSDLWSWRQEELDQQIIHLRLACADADFKSVHSIQRAEILTNLGNAFNKIGRSVEAIQFYDGAIKARPAFAMALGNKGRALIDYAAACHDQGHQCVLLSHSHLNLSDCLKGAPEHGRAHFQGRLDWVSSKIKEPVKVVDRSIRSHKLGRSKIEVAYRKWVLSNRLFLNPLNDLGSLEIAAHDPLGLPPLTTPIGTGPKYHGLFNQLKQEFISARYFLYDGLHARTTHFSDRQTQLVDTLDYPAYGLAVEKAKISLRMSYSILDKIAFFLNDYLKLGIAKKRVDFTSIWHLKGQIDKGLNPLFAAQENWPLRGLYWLSRDGFDDTITADKAIDPDSREVKDLRHALEHRYVKVHMEGVPTRIDGDLFFDELAHSLTRGRLEEMALRALKSSRAALIYLSLGINSHERAKNRVPSKGKAFPISLPKFDDRFKN